MRRLIFAVLCLVSISAFAEVKVKEAWIRPSVHGLSGVIAMDVLNTSEGVVVLTGAEVPGVRQVKLQLTGYGALGRRTLQDVAQIDVPAFSYVAMDENGLHLALQGVEKPLKVGVEVPVVLHFKDHPSQTVRMPVLGRAPDERDM